MKEGTTEDIGTRAVGHRWQPGESGNPNGRPVGSRTAFSNAFLRDLSEVWTEYGKGSIVHTAKTNPEVFFATCARLLPRDVQLSIAAQLPGQLNAEDWQMLVELLTAVKQALPDAGQRSPGDVLRLVHEGIRMASATPIEGCTE